MEAQGWVPLMSHEQRLSAIEETLDRIQAAIGSVVDRLEELEAADRARRVKNAERQKRWRDRRDPACDP